MSAIVTATKLSELDDSDIGVGGRFAWRPLSIVGLEAEITFAPSDLPDPTPISRGRTSAMFGANLGTWLGGVRPFVAARSGVLKMQSAPRPFPCIAIFPPPLTCQLGGGATLTAFELGGGADLRLAPHTFVRLGASDLLLKYPGPSFDRDRGVHNKAFFGHNLRISAGAGLMF